MKILVDITHPAHAHFFRVVIPRLRSRGHQVQLASRNKDVTVALLDAMGLEHDCLSRAATSKLGLLGELFVRNWRLWRLVRRLRPDVILAKHGLFACQVGQLAQVPSISFDDTDDAWLQQKLYFPFATRLYTDRAYRVPHGKRHHTYQAVSALAYLHPSVFRPSPLPPELNDGRRLIVCRRVSWTASHDVGHHGFADRFEEIVTQLADHGRVVISHEDRLPESLACYGYRLPVEQMHNLLAAASLYVGESATMAAEAAVLGTPAIHVSTRSTWYTRELEQRGLLHNTPDLAKAFGLAKHLLANPDQSAADHQEQLTAYLDEADDLVQVIVDAVEAFDGSPSERPSSRSLDFDSIASRLPQTDKPVLKAHCFSRRPLRSEQEVNCR